jgi:hypothetical protein
MDYVLIRFSVMQPPIQKPPLSLTSDQSLSDTSKETISQEKSPLRPVGSAGP